MSKQARSARGDIVDFDLLAIKQQLATAPIPVGATQRRKFIDEKDGFKTRTVHSMDNEDVLHPVVTPLPSALSFGLEAAAISANAQAKKSKSEK
jgi:hypothetical protein